MQLTDKHSAVMDDTQESRYTFVASAVSIGEQQPNDIYMSIRMRMFTTKPNSNNEAVTKGFIQEIIANQERYICLPLMADVAKIEKRDLRGLGHMLDRKAGRYYTQQIGSFYSFEMVEEDDCTALIGTARVPKRNKAVQTALADLFEEGRLTFSFEIMAREVIRTGGVLTVDAAEGNALIGMAVVSTPAYPDSLALELVAQKGEDLLDKPFAVVHIAEDDTDALTAEVSFETVEWWIHEYVYDTYYRNSNYDKYGNVNKLTLTNESFVIYVVMTGQMIKHEYLVKDNALIVTDIYEVDFVRKTEVQRTLDNVNKDVTQATEEEVKTTEAEVKQEETVIEETIVVSEEVPNAEEAEQVIEPVQEPEAEIAIEAASQAEVNIETLRHTIKQLEDELAERDRLLAEVKLEKLQDNAKRFALKAGLDVENAQVKDAIEKGDMAMLANLSIEQDDIVPESHPHTLNDNPFVAEMKLGNKWSDLLSPAK